MKPKVSPVKTSAGNAATQPAPVREPGTCQVLDMSTAESSRVLSFEYSRRPYYGVILLQGQYQLEVGDQAFALSDNTLLFTTPKVPFGVRSIDGAAVGMACVFTEPFISKHNSGYRLQEFPIYQPGQQQVYTLSDAQAVSFTAIFGNMFAEKLANNDFTHQLLRTYVLQLIFTAQRLTASHTFIRKNNTAEEIACAFVRLLEGQFPIETPQEMITLKTAKDFADQLALHPVYLNRQVKSGGYL